MEENTKIYICGKPPKSYNTNWKFEIENQLLKNIKNLTIINPDNDYINFNLNTNIGIVNFGRECFMLKNSDIIIIGLKAKDNIKDYPAIAIARKYKKKIIGLCFEKYDFENKLYCDKICTNIDELTHEIERITKPIYNLFNLNQQIVEAIEFYEKEHLYLDCYTNSIWREENAK